MHGGRAFTLQIRHGNGRAHGRLNDAISCRLYSRARKASWVCGWGMSGVRSDFQVQEHLLLSKGSKARVDLSRHSPLGLHSTQVYTETNQMFHREEWMTI